MNKYKKRPTTISKHKDQYFIDGILTNDAKVLNEIYQKYSKPILNLVTSNNGTVEDAKDIFQEGLIVLFRKVHDPKFQLTSSFLTYFYSICKYIWSNKQKKKRFKFVQIEKVPEPVDVFSIEKDIIQKERCDFYSKKFNELSEGCQKVLTLFYEGKKMQQIADIMGFASASYAAKRKHNCKEKLIKIITEDKFYNEIRL
jgi:RNA polymerase sigma factor (sigma-70 family)